MRVIDLREVEPRAEGRGRRVAIGTFDGVHRGHRRVLETAAAAAGRLTVVTFDPHPRTVLGNRVEMISTLERRLELLAERGVEETLVVEFTLDLSQLEPEEFAERYLRSIGAATSAAGRSASRRRTSPSRPSFSCPRTGSTPARRGWARAPSGARRSRSA